MCRATLLPDPDIPLRTMMRTAARLALSRSLEDAASGAQRAALDRVMVRHLLLVLLDASIELVGQEIDGGIHVFLGRVRMDRIAAHVQGSFGLLSQFLH